MNDIKNAPVSDFCTLRRAERLRTLPESKVKLFERVYTGKTAPRTAIKAFCNECLGFMAIDIRNCTAPACPLYEFRPYQVK